MVYFVAFCLLLVTLTAANEWQARTAGRFGVVGLVAALVGTFALGGDLWFETFAVQWLADRSPASLETTPSTLLGVGAAFSYGSFAVGWALFGVASLRARIFHAGICAALVLGGLLGYQALVAPFGAFLGLAVAALGAWMIRATTAAAEAPGPLVRTVPATRHPAETGSAALSPGGPGRSANQSASRQSPRTMAMLSSPCGRPAGARSPAVAAARSRNPSCGPRRGRTPRRPSGPRAAARSSRPR